MKSKANTNNKIIGADSLTSSDLGGLTAKAASAAADAIGLLSGSQSNSQAALNRSLAGGLGALGNMYGGLGSQLGVGLNGFGSSLSGGSMNNLFGNFNPPPISNAEYFQSMQQNIR